MSAIDIVFARNISRVYFKRSQVDENSLVVKPSEGFWHEFCLETTPDGALKLDVLGKLLGYEEDEHRYHETVSVNLDKPLYVRQWGCNTVSVGFSLQNTLTVKGERYRFVEFDTQSKASE